MRRLSVGACVGVGMAAFVGAGASSALALAPGPLAGYSAPPSAAPTQTVTASLKVPTLKCAKIPAGGFQALVAGVRIEEPSGMATMNSGGSVLLQCEGPMPRYLPHIQVDGTNIGSGITINPGDTITATASVSASAATVTLEDGGQSQTASGAGSSVIAEDVGSIAVNCNEAHQCAPVPHAAKTTFKNALIDGLSPEAAGASKRELVDAKGEVEMASSELKTKHRDSFAVTWLQSCGNGGPEGNC
jgi:Peptidase A4 family